MRCWLVEQVTDDGDMAWAEQAEPVPSAGELVVRIEAAGVNFADTLMVRGRYQRKPTPPFVPGIEVSGEVVAAGADCVHTPGQRICASVPTGGYAEFALVQDKAATLIPDDVPSDVALVLLGVNYPTAYYALHHRADLRPGETVLVHAGAGGVGSAAIQIALAAGCRVIATAGSEAKLAVCRDLGAVIYDPVGGKVGTDSLRCLAWQGRLLVIGFAGGVIPELPSNRLLLKDASALGVFWGEVKTRYPDVLRDVQASLLALHRKGHLDPLIGSRFGLADAPLALGALAGRKTVGKILLVPAREPIPS
jgi:NADPH2:quinone reductase